MKDNANKNHPEKKLGPKEPTIFLTKIADISKICCRQQKYLYENFL